MAGAPVLAPLRGFITARPRAPFAAVSRQSTILQSPAATPLRRGGSLAGSSRTHTFCSPWAVPRSARLWTNYTFACDFKEHLSQPCVLELQLKDVRGGQIHFTKSFTPNPITHWGTIRASLD